MLFLSFQLSEDEEPQRPSGTAAATPGAELPGCPGAEARNETGEGAGGGSPFLEFVYMFCWINTTCFFTQNMKGLEGMKWMFNVCLLKTIFWRGLEGKMKCLDSDSDSGSDIFSLPVVAEMMVGVLCHIDSKSPTHEPTSTRILENRLDRPKEKVVARDFFCP